VLAALAASVIAACGGGGHVRPNTTAIASRTVPVVHATVPAPPRPLPPGTAALRTSLNGLFGSAGPNTGGSVYDLTDHVSLFSLRAGIARPPASVEKLYTSVAVLDKLGPNATLQTRVFGTGYLGADGVWHGNLYLRGGGDPTFGDQTFNRIWEDGQGPTATELASQLQHAGIRRVSGHVIADGSLFDAKTGPPSSGFQPDIPDLGGELSALTFDHGSSGANLSPATFADRQLARTMRAMGIAARATRNAGSVPIGARLLATVSSPPMSVMLRLMDVPSDDFFAEMFAKQLGVQFGTGGSTAAGAHVISSVIATYGVHPRIVDGSGLSRSDHSSPRQVVELLKALSGTTIGRELDSALPTVGVNGTVQTIAVHTAAQGHCIAKTGTLNNVTNLAGYCNSRSGKRLAFALLIDGPSNGAALPVIGQMIAAIARL
jgi:serine-type D-Ala-D-Ala carboxypeptidase/endopeptidase (penicillin-binding protein 4)